MYLLFGEPTANCTRDKIKVQESIHGRTTPEMATLDTEPDREFDVLARHYHQESKEQESKLNQLSKLVTDRHAQLLDKYKYEASANFPAPEMIMARRSSRIFLETSISHYHESELSGTKGAESIKTVEIPEKLRPNAYTHLDEMRKILKASSARSQERGEWTGWEAYECLRKEQQMWELRESRLEHLDNQISHNEMHRAEKDKKIESLETALESQRNKSRVANDEVTQLSTRLAEQNNTARNAESTLQSQFDSKIQEYRTQMGIEHTEAIRKQSVEHLEAIVSRMMELIPFSRCR